MKQRIKDFLRTKPRLFDALKSVNRRMPRQRDAAFNFFDQFSRSHGRQVRFIQVGANDGLRNDPVREFIVRDRWQGLLIEPLPTVFALLKDNYSYLASQGLVFVNAAISDLDSSHLPFYTFHDAFLDNLPLETRLDYLRKASFHRAHVEHHIGAGNKESIKTIDVPCMTLGSLIKKYWQWNTIDLIVIDAEGHEDAIIRSMDFSEFAPEAIFFESHNLADKEERLSEFLTGKGYSINKLGGDTTAILKRTGKRQQKSDVA
jgi:FkbM family methyltransferase